MKTYKVYIRVQGQITNVFVSASDGIEAKYLVANRGTVVNVVEIK